MENHYLRLFIYSAIAASFILAFKAIFDYAVLGNYLIVMTYLSLAIFNILFLNRIECAEDSLVNRWRFYALYSVLYILLSVAIVVAISLIFTSPSSGISDVLRLLGLNRHYEIVYLALLPLVFVKIQNKISRFKWF